MGGGDGRLSVHGVEGLSVVDARSCRPWSAWQHQMPGDLVRKRPRTCFGDDADADPIRNEGGFQAIFDGFKADDPAAQSWRMFADDAVIEGPGRLAAQIAGGVEAFIRQRREIRRAAFACRAIRGSHGTMPAMSSPSPASRRRALHNQLDGRDDVRRGGKIVRMAGPEAIGRHGR